MRKNMTEIVFILDSSGSMRGLETDTIGGFNSMIEKQKKENGEALISTVLFDNVSEVIHDRVPVQKVEPMDTAMSFVAKLRKILPNSTSPMITAAKPMTIAPRQIGRAHV